jgi:hypothetical protein
MSPLNVSLQVEVLWVVTPCSDVVGYQPLGGGLWLHAPGDGVSTVLRNVGILPHHYTASQPRKTSTLCSSPWKAKMLVVTASPGFFFFAEIWRRRNKQTTVCIYHEFPTVFNKEIVNLESIFTEREFIRQLLMICKRNSSKFLWTQNRVVIYRRIMS